MHTQRARSGWVWRNRVANRTRTQHNMRCRPVRVYAFFSVADAAAAGADLDAAAPPLPAAAD